MAKFYFAVYQTYILPMASGALADCKFLVCRRQMKRLPIASGCGLAKQNPRAHRAATQIISLAKTPYLRYNKLRVQNLFCFCTHMPYCQKGDTYGNRCTQ